MTNTLDGATPVGKNHDDDGGIPKWLMWLLGLLLLAALAIGIFFLAGGDADVDVDPGDIDAPELEVDIDAPDVDVDAPDVDVDGGDIDIEDGDADADLDPDK